MDSMMAKKKKNRLAALQKGGDAKKTEQATGGFGMMPNDCELGLSPGPVNGK